MRVGVYARVSTNQQETENQLAQLREFTNRQGWQIMREYVDHVTGGTADREQFQAMFKDASQRRFDVLLFWSLDRLSREGVLPTLQYLTRLTDYGIEWRSFSEQYLDSTGIFKDAVIGILAAIAKQEKVRISERTKAGLARAKAKGQRLGRRKADVTPEQVEAALAAGKSYREAAKLLKVSPGTVWAIKNNGPRNSIGG